MARSPHWTALLCIPWNSPIPPDIYRHLTKLLAAHLLLWRESTWEQSQQTQVRSPENHQEMKPEPWSKCAWNQYPMWITPLLLSIIQFELGSLSLRTQSILTDTPSCMAQWITKQGSVQRYHLFSDLTQTSSSLGVGAFIGLRQPVSQA